MELPTQKEVVSMTIYDFEHCIKEIQKTAISRTKNVVLLDSIEGD